METIIIQAESKKAKALKQFLKAFGIDFKVEQTPEESPYDPEFVKKILKARNENGGKVIDPSNLWGSLK
jgi:arsenate reductase-like glutaredoxin family protein